MSPTLKIKRKLTLHEAELFDDVISAAQSEDIPDGRERPAKIIQLFDSPAGLAPLDASKYVYFLCAPKALYNSLRYAAAVNHMLLSAPEDAELLFASKIWLDSAHWRATYRDYLEHVTHCTRWQHRSWRLGGACSPHPHWFSPVLSHGANRSQCEGQPQHTASGGLL